MSDAIPVIDFSNPNRKQTAEALAAEAMKTVGFAYLDKLDAFEAAFEHRVLEAVKWFFDLPLEKKLKYAPKKFNPDATNLYMGYYPAESPDVKEFLKFKQLVPKDPLVKSLTVFYESNPWPFDEGGPGVAQRHFQVLADYEAMLERSGIEAARLLAPELGLSEEEFAAKFQPTSTSDLKLLHYNDAANGSNAPEVTFEAHVDDGYFTLFTHLGYRGLQLYLDDNWVDFDPCPGLLGFNIGNDMVKLSGGKFKATLHRVVDIGTERYSVPYFFNPCYDSTFNTIGQNGKQTTVKFGHVYQNSIRVYSESPFFHIPPPPDNNY